MRPRLALVSLLLTTACITSPQNEDLVPSTSTPVDFVGYWLSGGELLQLQRAPTRDGPWSTFTTVTSSNYALNVYNTDLYAYSTSTVIPGWVSTGCGEEVYVRVYAPSSGFSAVTFDGENADVEQTGFDCLGDELDAGVPLTKAATNCASEDYPAIRLRTQLLAGTTPSNVNISNQGEANEVACYTEIDGSLTIADSSAMSISLAHLERVTGDVHLYYSRQGLPSMPIVRTIDLPSLHTVDGSVFVHYPGDTSDIATIDLGLPALTSVGGGVHVDLVTFNATMSGMASLESIAGDVSITTSGDDYTNGTLMRSVTWVGGDMDFAFGGTTEDLFDALVEVDGSIRIVGALFNPDLGGFGASNFPMLTTVHGNLSLAASSIITVPGVTHQFPSLSTVDGTFNIDTGGITELLLGNPSGMEVGNLRLNQNFGLTDLAVTHVDVGNLGTIEITNNANLGDCEADAFIDAQAAMGWMGTAIVSGNGSC